MEFFHKKTNFPFMATRRVWYTLSAVMMIVCFVSFASTVAAVVGFADVVIGAGSGSGGGSGVGERRF